MNRTLSILGDHVLISMNLLTAIAMAGQIKRTKSSDGNPANAASQGEETIVE
jgi:hypothetical protein